MAIGAEKPANSMESTMNLRGGFLRSKTVLPVLSGILLFHFLNTALRGQPQYSAFTSHTCQSCHVSPTGGFGRWPFKNSLSFADERVFLSGDLRFLALYDQRVGTDRSVLFPMEGTLSVGVEPMRLVTIAYSNDFGTSRELYALLQNFSRGDFYVRVGWFTLPYGLLVPDHTAFIKEGRVEGPGSTLVEKGIGAGLFGTRYKDAGVELGLSGKPFFINAALTNGLGSETRPLSSSETDTEKAVTARAGYMGKHFLLGGSLYENKIKSANVQQKRYGVFGWVVQDPLLLLMEYDRGIDDPLTVSGSTKTAAAYAELYWHSRDQIFPGYAKLRYEFLDPNDRIVRDELGRWQGAYEWFLWPAGSLEMIYRNNREKPAVNNDDYMIMTHFYF